MANSITNIGAGLSALLFCSTLYGQQILLFPIDSNDRIGAPIAVGNNDGYNNQPAFSSNSKQLFYSSSVDGKQMDIFAYNIASRTLANRTNTANENEFSPQSGDGPNELIYVVEQGVPDQSVWRQIDGQARQRAINSYIDSGYYARIADVGTLLWARYGHHLYFEPVGEQADERHFVVDSVGRSIHTIPTQTQFSFVHKQINGSWVIKRFDPNTGAITPLIPISQRSEDYTWKDATTIWKGDGSEVQQWQLGQQQWQTVIDLNQYGVNQIGRLDVSPDGKWLALVELESTPQ